MNTSQYDNRKQFKRDQRTPAYRELQRRTADERTKLEQLLKQRGELIKKLAGRLNMSATEVRELLQDDATSQAA